MRLRGLGETTGFGAGVAFFARFARTRFKPGDFTRLRDFALPDLVVRRDAIDLHLFASYGS